MTFDEYVTKCPAVTAVYPQLGENLVYPALGAAGEAGELAEKIKKLWRVSGSLKPTIDYETKVALMKEMGDILWYLGALCVELRVSFDSVAKMNVDKLTSRMNRGVLKGEGDDR